jgi:hypothetical protein
MTKAAELAKMGEVLTNGQIGGRRNMVINGAMNVAQRSTSVTGIGASATYFTVDRLGVAINGTTAGRVTMSQASDGPSGFANSMKYDVTTADTSIASSESFGCIYRIEGQDVQQFKKGTSDAERGVLSFYVKGTAKTFVVEIRDDNSRQQSHTFSVTSEWSRVVIPITADTTGAIDDDNTTGLTLVWWLHAGTDFTSGTISNDWVSSVNANRMVGCESIFSSTDNEFFITGVQLEVGSQATPFEHRSFGEELALCHRYGFNIAGVVSGKVGVGQAVSSTLADILVNHPATMRAAPTLPSPDASGANITNGSGSGIASTGIALQSATPNTTRLRVTVSSGLTAGQGSQLSFDATDDAFLSAEL